MVEKPFYIVAACCEGVIRKAVEKNLTVARLRDPFVQQRQHSAIAPAADQPAETLFQRDGRLWDLIGIESVAALLLDRSHARLHHRIAGDRERQFVDDHATQLLAWHIYTLPE